jgi:hypothetical protein
MYDHMWVSCSVIGVVVIIILVVLLVCTGKKEHFGCDPKLPYSELDERTLQSGIYAELKIPDQSEGDFYRQYKPMMRDIPYHV